MRLETSILPVKLAFILMIALAFSPSVQGAPARPKHVNTAAMTQAFMRAAYDGNLRRMQALLSEGANVAVTDETGENALVSAASGGQARSVSFLLDHGVSAKDKNGDEALFTAVDEGQAGIVSALLRHGANVNARDKGRDNATPLMIACFYDPGEDDAFGQSADIVRLLLLHKADVKAKDSFGKTALVYLKKMPNARIHRMLLKAGATK